MREHDLLADQPREVAVGLQEGRALPAQQSGLDLAHVAGEERREREHERDLAELNERVEDQFHTARIISSTTSAPNTRVRYARIVRNCTLFRRSATNLTRRAVGS